MTLGWTNVRSYVASGNIVFEAAGGNEALADALHEALPFDVPVLVLDADDLKRRYAHCPVPRTAGKLAHGFFCMDRPDIDMDVLAQFRTTEELFLYDHTVWLHTPDGFAKSKVATALDRIITGTTFTGRNINTIGKLVEMLDS